MTTGAQIRQLRQARGLTQRALAELAGLHQPEIARLEQPGYLPSMRVLEKVVKALGGRVEVKIYAAERGPIIVEGFELTSEAVTYTIIADWSEPKGYPPMVSWQSGSTS